MRLSKMTGLALFGLAMLDRQTQAQSELAISGLDTNNGNQVGITLTLSSDEIDLTKTTNTANEVITNLITESGFLISSRFVGDNQTLKFNYPNAKLDDALNIQDQQTLLSAGPGQNLSALAEWYRHSSLANFPHVLVNKLNPIVRSEVSAEVKKHRNFGYLVLGLVIGIPLLSALLMRYVTRKPTEAGKKAGEEGYNALEASSTEMGCPAHPSAPPADEEEGQAAENASFLTH